MKSRIHRRDPDTGAYAPLRLPPASRAIPNHRERLEAQARARIDAEPIIVEAEPIGTSGGLSVVGFIFWLLVFVALFRACHGA